MENIFSAIIGILCIVLGVLNCKGNISLLHSYHRKRVAEEDILPFGRLVGIGMIIVGIALIFMGCLMWIANVLQENVYANIGTIGLIVGLVVGLSLTFYAMIKYNKGIF